MAAVKKIFTAITGSLSIFILSVSSALAQITNPVVGDLGSADVVDEAVSGNLFVRYFIQLWSVVISIGAIIVIVMFLWGALEWITAGSDTGKVQGAQQRLMNAALGLFLLVASFAIIEFISLIFFDGQFNILNLTLPTGTAGGD